MQYISYLCSMKHKDSKKYWLLGAGVFLWWLVGRTANAALNLQFKFAGLRFLSIDNERQRATIAIEVAFKNITQHSMLVRNIAGKLYFNDAYIAHIDQRVNRHIAGGSVSVLSFVVDVNYNEVVQGLKAQLESNSLDNWAINLQGSLSVDNLYLPLNLNWYAEDFIYSKN